MESTQEGLARMLRRSKIRKGVLKALLRSMRNAEKIAASTDFRLAHVRSALKQLHECKAVSVVNPHDKNPDIFKITDVGRNALKESETYVPKKRKPRAKTFRLSGKRRSVL